MTPTENFLSTRLQLPTLMPSKGIHKPAVEAGGLLYVSGHISVNQDGTPLTGKVGTDLTVEQGASAARQCGLAILVTLQNHLGTLDKVKRIVKTFGMVNSTQDFDKHTEVINGCSDLFQRVWGEKNGRGVRSAVGMASLPKNASVEVEAVFEIL